MSAPRLEWTANGNVSRAEVGPCVLLAWKQGWWEVRVNSEAKPGARCKQRGTRRI